jgi:hypothetical protein
MSEPGLFDDVAWLARQWDMVRDGGVWAIPRSGIVLQKDEPGRRWIVSARMPHMEGMPVTAEELREQQDAELEGIAARYEVVGIAVVEREERT